MVVSRCWIRWLVSIPHHTTLTSHGGIKDRGLEPLRHQSSGKPQSNSSQPSCLSKESTISALISRWKSASNRVDGFGKKCGVDLWSCNNTSLCRWLRNGGIALYLWDSRDHSDEKENRLDSLDQRSTSHSFDKLCPLLNPFLRLTSFPTPSCFPLFLSRQYSNSSKHFRNSNSISTSHIPSFLHRITTTNRCSSIFSLHCLSSFCWSSIRLFFKGSKWSTNWCKSTWWSHF